MNMIISFGLHRSAQITNIQRSINRETHSSIRNSYRAPLAADLFFSGKTTKKNKAEHNANEKASRIRKRNKVVALEGMCREIGIDPDTLMPPHKTLPPLTSVLSTEKMKRERHNLVEKNYRERKRLYLQNLEEAVHNGELTSPKTNEAEQLTEAALTATDAPFLWEEENLAQQREYIRDLDREYINFSRPQTPSSVFHAEITDHVPHKSTDPEVMDTPYTDEFFRTYFDDTAYQRSL